MSGFEVKLVRILKAVRQSFSRLQLEVMARVKPICQCEAVRVSWTRLMQEKALK